MAIRARNFKQLFREAGGVRAYRSKLREMFGIEDDPRGAAYPSRVNTAKAKIGPDDFGPAVFREISEAFLGRDFVSELHAGPLSSGRMSRMQAAFGAEQERQERERTLVEEMEEKGASAEEIGQKLLAEESVGVMPGTFGDINAWNATVGGLIEVRLLEGYHSPEFIWRDFVEIQPTRVNGGKIIGIPYIGRQARFVEPGIEFPSAGMNELGVWARPNKVLGLKLALTREAVVYDISGELLASAETLGKDLGYAQEYMVAGGVMGLNNVVEVIGNSSAVSNVVINHPEIGDSFIMFTGPTPGPAATPNPTFQSTAVTTNGNLYNYVNAQTSNSLTDWTQLQKAQQLLNLMRDPVNGLPFKTEITHVLVDPAKWQLALYIKHQTQVFNVTGTPAATYGPLVQGTGSTFPPAGSLAPGYGSDLSELNRWNPYHSNIWHKVLLDAQVAEGSSAGQAQDIWFAGDPKKAFVWRSAWDLRVDQANPSSSELLQKNIVNMWVAQWSGQFVVREPRYFTKNSG